VPEAMLACHRISERPPIYSDGRCLRKVFESLVMIFPDIKQFQRRQRQTRRIHVEG
jgi:hypothetical protein